MPAYSEKACPSHEGMIIKTPNNCCDDRQIKIDRVEHKASLPHVDLQVDITPFIGNTAYAFSQPVATSHEDESFSLKRPPPADRDIYIRIQSFLL